MASQVPSICCRICLIIVVYLHAALDKALSSYSTECSTYDYYTYAVSGDCTKYIRCTDGKPSLESCAKNTYYNPETSQCDLFSQFRCVMPYPLPEREITDQENSSDLKEVKRSTSDRRALLGEPERPSKRLMCYYNNKGQNRRGLGRFAPENIDPFLCTHIIYGFVKLNRNSEMEGAEENDESEYGNPGMIEKVINLKQKNPQLKVLLSLGGWDMGSTPFTVMVSTKDRKDHFIKDTMHAFQEEAKQTGKDRLLLTAAVAAAKTTIDKAYEIPIICEVLDYILLMSYDFHGSWENVTGHGSPLYPPPNAQGQDQFLNVQFAANYWVEKGCPKEKLLIGLATYGRSFTLADSNNSGLNAPSTGPGNELRLSNEPGLVAYYEVCGTKKNGKVIWLQDMKVPYVVYVDQLWGFWTGYENPQSMFEKVKFIKDNGFAGAMVWSLELDDFRNKFCKEGPYPLITTIKNNLLS